MISGDIPGRCVRTRSSSANPRISPLAAEYEYPCRPAPLYHYRRAQHQRLQKPQRRSPPSLFHAIVSTDALAAACATPSALNTLVCSQYSSLNSLASQRQTLGHHRRAPVSRLFPTHSRKSTSSAQTLLRFSASLSTYDYELFNCNNSDVRYWSWNYRSCWHQTCPPIAFGPLFTWPSVRSATLAGRGSSFLFTTALCQIWVICAPAAFLGCGGRLSGPLSGIRP